MSSSLIINLDENGFVMRLYRFAGDFNYMFWKLSYKEIPTNLCPLLQTMFFFPTAAGALLFLAYRFFFGQVAAIWSQITTDSTYSTMVLNIITVVAVIAGGIIIIAGIIAGIQSIFEALGKYRSSRKQHKIAVAYDKKAAKRLSQFDIVVTNTSDKPLGFWGFLVAWLSAIHDKTCLPITVINYDQREGK